MIHNAHTSTSPDENVLYAVAESQAGYFTTAQAGDAGYSRALVAHHAKSGSFARVRSGVYRLVRFPATAHEDLYVAWLQAGSRAVVSHESALAVYDLSDVLPSEIHLTLPRTSSRRRPGIRMHTSALAAEEVTARDGLPVTAVARTIADVIRSGLSSEHAAQAITEALDRGMVTEADLRAQAQKHRGRVADVVISTLAERAAR